MKYKQFQVNKKKNKSMMIGTTWEPKTLITSCTLSDFGPAEPLLDFLPWSEVGTAAEKRFSSSDMSISGALHYKRTNETAYEIYEEKSKHDS